MNDIAQHPSISVVIIAYNEEATIDYCIEAACQQDYPRVDAIIVVDGNSTDRTQEIARQWQKKDKRIRIIIEDPNRPHRGTSEARRAGIEAAQGEYVLLLNGDVTVASSYVSSLMNFLQNNNLTGVAGLRWCRNATFVEDFVNIRYWFTYQANPKHIQHPDYLSSDAALYRRADLLSVGNFDPALTGAGDDFDIGCRLVSHNKHLRYYSSLLIFHKDKHYRNPIRYICQRLWYGQGMAQLGGKYPFRYIAEQNKIRNFIIRPFSRLMLWLAFTFATACFSWQLTLAVQLWPLWGALKLVRQGWRARQSIGKAATPTRIRPICCWLWPIFEWLSYVFFTISCMYNIEPVDVLYRKWLEEPVYSGIVKAVNQNFVKNNNT